MLSLRAGGIALVRALALPARSAHAEVVTICYNYGCYARTLVDHSETQLERLHLALAAAADAKAEREAISAVIARMYAIAGEQTPVWRDKGGNYADGGENGKVDCIDHSTNTSACLRLLEAHGWLRFHEVVQPVMRRRLLTSEHWAARIRERETQADYVVDSWFFDNGHPALVLPVKHVLAEKTPRVW